MYVKLWQILTYINIIRYATGMPKKLKRKINKSLVWCQPDIGVPKAKLTSCYSVLDFLPRLLVHICVSQYTTIKMIVQNFYLIHCQNVMFRCTPAIRSREFSREFCVVQRLLVTRRYKVPVGSTEIKFYDHLGPHSVIFQECAFC